MKQLFLVAALALGAASCADDLRPIQVGNPTPLNTDCTLESVSRYAGSLDIALAELGVPLENISYVLSFNISSLLESVSTSVGGSPVGDETRNNFVVDEIELSYTSQPAHTFATESIPAYLIIAAGAKEARMNINLVTPKALQGVKELVDSTGAPVTLLATFKLKGKLASGQSAESNTATFPITVYKSQFSGCPQGQVLSFNGPCTSPGGQDNHPLQCQPPTATP